MKKTPLILALMLCPWPVIGQQGALQGTSTLGGISATTQGAQSSNKLQGVIPAAKISIFLTGTTNLATLTTDGTHSLANPFYSNASNGVNPGGFIAFAATNAGYDIVASSGQGVPNCTTAPLCYTQPVTLCKDCFPSGQFTVVGGVNQITGSNGFNCTSASCNISGASVLLQHNGSTLATQNKLNFLDATPSLPSGYNPVIFGDDGSGGFGGSVAPTNPGSGLQMQTVVPTANTTYITVYPSGHSTNMSGGPLGSVSGSNTSGYALKPACGIGQCTGSPSITNTVTWTFTLPSYVNPANVTAVYAQSSASSTYLGGSGFQATATLTCTVGVNSYQLLAATLFSLPMGVVTQHMTAATGSTVSTITCVASASATNPIQTGQDINVASIYLQLADSIDTAPTSTALNIVPPLFINQALNELGIDPQASFFGSGLKVYTVATLPVAPVSFAIYPVRDGSSGSDCVTGGGSSHVMCYWNGSSYAAF